MIKTTHNVVFKMPIPPKITKPIPPKIPTKSTVAMDVEKDDVDKDVLDTDKGDAQKWVYEVVVTDVGKNKADVVKCVHGLTGEYLIDCEERLDDDLPTILDDVEKVEALAAKALLEEAGASVVIKKWLAPRS